MPLISNAVFHFAKRVTGNSMRGTRRSAVATTSRAIMAAAGMRMGADQACSFAKARSASPTSSLSAIGSRKAPNRLTACNRRAAQPSTKSVAATIRKLSKGNQDGSGKWRMSQATTAAKPHRVQVRAFGNQARREDAF